MKIRNKAIATGVSVALTLTMTPVVALADEAASRDAASSQAVASDGALQDSALAAETVEESAVVVEEDAEAAAPEAAQDAAPAAGDASIAQDAAASDALPDWIPEGGYDKAEFYSEAEEDGIEMLSDSARAASVYPVKISKDMLYFGAYEGGTYDRTFSYGDGYHALGFYQFDHRYGLQNFLIACYNYDPAKFSMFKQFISIPAAQFQAADAIRQINEEGVYDFTPLGKALNEAWVAAAHADGEGVAVADSTFARLQDGWAYENYYMPAERYLASRGIDISDRNDAVKGLCWGMSNLFGTSGWRKFVGGVSDGYDWNGVYHYLSEGYNWPGAGLTDDMTDTQFVSVLCDYVVENVAVFYKGQPQYHQGWQNRYKREKAQCLSIIQRTGDTHDIIAGSWYVPYVEEAMRLGIVRGFPEGDFRPEAQVTRAQVAEMLCRAEGEALPEGVFDATNDTGWSDNAPNSWYTHAMNWAYKNGIFEGDAAGDTTVRPDSAITREEMAKVIASYMEKFRGADIDATGLDWPNGEAATHDVEEVSDWAVPYFKWLANEGVMGGHVNNDGTVSLDPQGTATRAMFAKVAVVASQW